MAVRKFKKLPVVIEAMQIDFSDHKSIIDIQKWQGGNTPAMFHEFDQGRQMFTQCHIYTLEGPMEARNGDWIIKGVNGEFYPCKPDIFEKTYIEVFA